MTAFWYERLEEGEQKKGGIIIPDSAKEKPQRGSVVAVGNGKRIENGTIAPLDVKAGDQILFGKYSGTEVNVDDNEYLILREDESSRGARSGTRRRKKTRLPSNQGRERRDVMAGKRIVYGEDTRRDFGRASTSWPTRSR